MLSIKYYQKFADILKSNRQTAVDYENDKAAKLRTIYDIQRDMIRIFESDNPNFDKARFEQAAGI